MKSLLRSTVLLCPLFILFPQLSATSAPDAPTAVSGLGGNTQAVVSFTAPVSDGGAAITGYTVTASPGGATATGAASPLTVTGLTNGVSYTFTVTATNSAGTGAASSASPSVTPAVVSLGAVNFGLSGSTAYINATAVDAAGNVYIAGYFDGATLPVGVVTLTKIGTQDAFVAKFDATLTVVWAKNYGGSGASTHGQGLAVDGVGNVYMSGDFVFANLTTPVLTRIGNYDAFALKLDTSGNTTWAKNYGGSGASAVGKGIAVDRSGNVYLGGYFYDGSLTTPALTRIGNYDAFTLKLDTSGATTWSKNFGGGGASAVVQGIAVDGAGNVYLGGYFQSAGLTTPSLAKLGDSDAFALKLDVTGATTWAKSYGGSGAGTHGQSIAVDVAGNVYLGGYFQTASLTTPALTKLGDSDAFALKLDASGTTTWAKNFGGSGSSFSPGIAVDGAGNVYLSGYFLFTNMTTPALTKIGFMDAFALQLDASGTTTRAKNFGGSGANAYGMSIAVDVAGNVYLGGYFFNANLTTPALTKIGSTDAYLIARAFAPVTAPSAPTGVVAIGGNTQAVVSFTAPVSNGGAAITGYTVTASPGGATATGAASPITVTGLTNGVSYIFTVTATNSVGTGAASIASTSATPGDRWARNFGRSGSSATIVATAVDAAGYGYIAGTFNGATIALGSVTLTRIGIQDAFVAKYDVAGTVIWAKNFGGSAAYAEVRGVAVDGAGNVYLGGNFDTASLSIPALTKIGTADAFALKLDSDGTTIWANNYGGSGAHVYVNGIAVDGAANVYLVGYDQGLPSMLGPTDAFALKLNAAGTAMWTKNFGGGGAAALGQAIAVDGAGNVYLAGYFLYANLTTPNLSLRGIQDAFALKLDAGGTTTWAKNYGGSGAATGGSAITVDGSGNVYLCGWFGSAGLTTPALTRIGNQDALVLKLNADGATTWAKNHGGSGAWAVDRDIAVDAAGNVYLAGYFNSANLTTPALTVIGSYDAFALKLDASGNATWSKNYGGSGATTYGMSIAVDVASNVYLGGYFSTRNLTTPALGRIGTQDALLIKQAYPFAADAAQPTLTTPTSASVTATTATLGGNVTSDSGASVTARGVVYALTATNANPQLGGTGVTNAAGTGTTGVFTVSAQGLTASTAYTYAAYATNSVGTAYSSTATFTTAAAAPGAPTSVVAIYGDTRAVVSFMTPVSNGGAAITGYTVTASPGGATVIGAASPLAITGLTNGVSYTFTVTATNSVGAGAASSSSPAVTPAIVSLGGANFGLSGSIANIFATAVDAAGNVYIAGHFDGATLPVGGVTLTRIGVVDAFVAKLDATRAVVWAKNYGGSGATTYGVGIAVDGSGNVYLGGQFETANLTTPALTKRGNSDAFALKLEASGATVWARNYGGSGAHAYGMGIAVDGSGNVYLGGHFDSANLTTPALTKLGNTDAFALKLDASGATTWARNYGGSGALVNSQGIAVDGSGNVYLGGWFESANLTTPALTKIGTQDAFALKLNASGTTTWAKNYGGSGACAGALGIALDGAGNVYLVGSFNYANLTSPALTKLGDLDAYALKLDASGNTTWAKNYGGSGASAGAMGIAVDGAGNVYLVGSFNYANLTSPALTKLGDLDAFALQLDATGATTLAKNFGGSGAQAFGESIAVDVAGNVYLGGGFAGANLTTPALTKTGSTDAFLIAHAFAPAPATPPGVPTSAVAISGNAQATVSFTAPVSNGGAAITGYTVTTNPGGTTATGAASPLTITGLTNGVSYTFTVTATNSAGTGAASNASPAVTPAIDYIGAVNFGRSRSLALVTSTTVDVAGNVYIAGYFDGATLPVGAVTLTRMGTQDAFVAKLDATRTVVWAKNFGGNGAGAVVSAIAVDGADNVYLSGYFYNANLTTPTLARIGSGDAFALKLDSSGATTWARNYGGNGAGAVFCAIAVDGAGNVYLGGYFNSSNLTTPVLAKIGNSDALALKLNASGTTTWAKNFGGSGASAYAQGIAVDGSGNVYLGGNFQWGSLTTPALSKIGSTDAFALKLNASGSTTWAKNYGGSGADAIGTSIAVDGSGSAYLGGYLASANLTTPTLAKIGGTDAFALKLDTSGATTWAKNYGGSGASVYGQAIAVDGSGNVYLGGYFAYENLATPTLTKIGNQDALALKIDTTGAITLAKNYGGSGALTAVYGIAVDVAGNVYLSGYFYNANLTTPVLTKIGSTDAFLITHAFAPAPPTVPGAPTRVVVFGGNAQATVSFTAPASNGGAAITGYTVTSSPTGGTDSNAGSTGLSHLVTGLTNGTSYTFTVTATNSAGTDSASSASAPVTPTQQSDGFLANLSVRAAMAPGQTLIVGFVVDGGAKPMLVRAAGPVLNQYGLMGVVDPSLTLFNDSTSVATNDNWDAALGPTFTRLGAFVFDDFSKDAALLQTIDGPHTAQATATGAGTILVEAYDAGPNDSRKLTNLSARFQVGTGDNILIAGFVAAGTGTMEFLIRAVGPTLAGYGVTGALADPQLAVYDGGTSIASNDNWDPLLTPTFDTVGAFHLFDASKDAAIAVTLAAGKPYTVQVSGVGGCTGEALVEIYLMQAPLPTR